MSRSFLRRAPLLALAALLAAPSLSSAQNWMHYPLDRATAGRVRLTQGFYGDYITYCGRRDACGTHNGYDIACASNTPVYAVAPGVVDAVNPVNGRTPDYGNAGLWVRVRHDASTVPGLPGTFFVTYMHLNRIDVTAGTRVTSTTRLGLSGNTGNVGAHLHLHLATVSNYCGSAVDPGCPTPAYVAGSVVSASFVDAPGCQSICRPVTIQWVQPAAYGGETYARPTSPGCGALDYRGRCDGETLHWCMNSAPMSAECLSRGGVCAWQNDTEGFNCLRCDPASGRPLLPGPRCEGARFVRCNGTTPLSEDCAARGQMCTPEGCVSPPPPDAGPPEVDVPIAMDVGFEAGLPADLGVVRDSTVRDEDTVHVDATDDASAPTARTADNGCSCRATHTTPRWRVGALLVGIGLVAFGRKKRASPSERAHGAGRGWGAGSLQTRTARALPSPMSARETDAR